MKEYFLKLFNYNEWANNQVIKKILNERFNDEETIKLFSHLISVQRMWLDRLLNKTIDYDVWQVYMPERFITLSKENNKDWIKLLEMQSEESITRIVKYTNTKGISYENSIEDIVTHVINHSS